MQECANPEMDRLIHRIRRNLWPPSMLLPLLFRGFLRSRYVLHLILFRANLRPSKPLRLKLIGYWHADSELDEGAQWPRPDDFIDESWERYEREDVARYLEHGFFYRCSMGNSHCRICGVSNGSLELTDGTYYWPEGLAHYVDAHNVRLPEEFLEHVRARQNELITALPDGSWWLTQGPSARTK